MAATNGAPNSSNSDAVAVAEVKQDGAATAVQSVQADGAANVQQHVQEGGKMNAKEAYWNELIASFVVTENDETIVNSWIRTFGRWPGYEDFFKVLMDEYFDKGTWDTTMDRYRVLQSLPRPIRSIAFAHIGKVLGANNPQMMHKVYRSIGLTFLRTNFDTNKNNLSSLDLNIELPRVSDLSRKESKKEAAILSEFLANSSNDKIISYLLSFRESGKDISEFLFIAQALLVLRIMESIPPTHKGSIEYKSGRLGLCKAIGILHNLGPSFSKNGCRELLCTASTQRASCLPTSKLPLFRARQIYIDRIRAINDHFARKGVENVPSYVATLITFLTPDDKLLLLTRYDKVMKGHITLKSLITSSKLEEFLANPSKHIIVSNDSFVFTDEAHMELSLTYEATRRTAVMPRKETRRYWDSTLQSINETKQINNEIENSETQGTPQMVDVQMPDVSLFENSTILGKRKIPTFSTIDDTPSV
eukprot:6213346-Pleurochrysis_carterae.AAC.7